MCQSLYVWNVFPVCCQLTPETVWASTSTGLEQILPQCFLLRSSKSSASPSPVTSPSSNQAVLQAADGRGQLMKIWRSFGGNIIEDLLSSAAPKTWKSGGGWRISSVTHFDLCVCKNNSAWMQWWYSTLISNYTLEVNVLPHYIYIRVHRCKVTALFNTLFVLPNKVFYIINNSGNRSQVWRGLEPLGENC